MNTQLELYQLVSSLAGLGIWERNLVTGETQWNTVIREIFEVDEHFTASLEEVLQFYKYPEHIARLISDVRETGTRQQTQAEIVTAKGRHKHVEVLIAAQLEDGQCTKIYGTLRDITDAMNLRRQYEDRETRFFQAFHHAPIGMALVSLEGEWMQANQSLCQLMGVGTGELLGKTFQELTHPEDLDNDLAQMRELIAGERDWYEMEKRYFHKDGHVIWALLKVSIVRDRSGVPLYFVSQIKDITQRKKNTEIIKNQNARLLNFAHIVSHNLRSHTGNIKMLTEMVMDEQDPVEKQALLGMLSQNAGNLLDTLFHLNEVVRINDEGFSDRRTLTLKTEIDRVLNILSASVRQAGAHVTVEVDPGLQLLLNPAYMESILINLVSNSLRYRDPERPLQISLSTQVLPQKVILSITDNGQGIDLDLHGQKLFGMYKTFHGNEDARGIGLFLVKNQVEVMGGKIAVTSIPGQGTTFTLTFSTDPL